MLNFFLYLGFTLLLVWVIQKQKLFDYLFWGVFLEELRKCKLCLGFWVALLLYFIFGKQTLPDSPVTPYLDPLFTALLMDYIAYYFSEGVQRNHGITRL